LLGPAREDDSEDDSFTMTGVPSSTALKKISATPEGKRMQPWEAAYGGT
jgi:hypothetical protein